MIKLENPNWKQNPYTKGKSRWTTPEERAFVAAYIREHGKGAAQKHFGCSRSFIRRCSKEHGIPNVKAGRPKIK